MKSRAVLYLRYSSDKQTEQSIEGQRRVCTEYAQKNDMAVVGEYVDRATSASKDIEKRVEFLRMIKDSEKHGFDVVLVYKMDRFAREVYEDAKNKRELRLNGVKVISATEVIPDDPMGVIIESLIAGMNEYYSKELRQKVLRGLRESALKCNSTGGTVPYGYKLVNKKLVPREGEAEIIKELFRKFADGAPLMAIIDDLNARGIVGRNGKPFTAHSFQNALRNQKYIGIYSYGDIVIPDGVPALVDRLTFEKVQARLEMKKGEREGRYKKTERGLGGKVYCGECGEKCEATSGKSKSGRMFWYYRCHNRCVPSVDRKKLEDAVFHQILQNFTPEKIEKIAEEFLEERRASTPSQNELAAKIEELNVLKRKEESAKRMYYLPNGEVDEIFAKDLEEIREQQRIVSEQIASFQDVWAMLEKSDIVAFLQSCMEGAEDTPEFRQRVFDKLVHRVYLFSDRIVYTTKMDGYDDESDAPLHAIKYKDVGVLGSTPSTTTIAFCTKHLAFWVLGKLRA